MFSHSFSKCLLSTSSRLGFIGSSENMIENIYQADGCDSSPYRTYSLVDPTDMNQLIINNGKIPAAIGATEEKCVVP